MCGLSDLVSPPPFSFRAPALLFPQDLYVSANRFVKKGSNNTLQKIQETYTAGEKNKRDLKETLKEVMQMFPPIMHRWFVNAFVVPADWFEARTAFAHTAAVWSMVGHIVGLGDRHGENLLLDSASGDVVHVDFSCLFDKARMQRRRRRSLPPLLHAAPLGAPLSPVFSLRL